MSFHVETPVKRTRKTCSCDWCNEPILAGNPSVVTRGVYEGDFCSARYHPECNAAITRYYTVNNCWGEEMPDEPSNRGGIMPKGEPE